MNRIIKEKQDMTYLIISQTLQEKIWEMIWRRWCAYEDFCHSR